MPDDVNKLQAQSDSPEGDQGGQKDDTAAPEQGNQGMPMLSREDNPDQGETQDQPSTSPETPKQTKEEEGEGGKEPPAEEPEAPDRKAEEDEGKTQELSLDLLPEELRNHEVFQGYENLDQLLEDLRAGQDARKGIPESPDAYQADIPLDSEGDKAFLEAFLAVAHKAGLTQRQVDHLVGWHNHNLRLMQQHRKRAQEEAIKALKEKHGDDYPEVVRRAQEAVEKLASPEMRQWLEATGAGDHPAFVDFFATLGRAIAEDSLVLPEPAPQDVLRTPGGEPMFRRGR